MTVEAPESIRRGEQIGLRLDIFNNWDQDLEVNALFVYRVYIIVRSRVQILEYVYFCISYLKNVHLCTQNAHFILLLKC